MNPAKMLIELGDKLLQSEREQLVHQIQLDAIKHGMTLAATIVVNDEEMQPITDSERNTGLACRCAILTARDKLTEIPK